MKSSTNRHHEVGESSSRALHRSRSPSTRGQYRDYSSTNSHRRHSQERGRSRSRIRERSPSPARVHEKTRSRTRSPDRYYRHRARSRSESRSRKRGSRRSRSRSSSSDDDREKRRRREKKRRRSRSSSRSRSRERKREKRERKEKRSKKEKKSKKSAAVGAEWGKYGLINDTDMYKKEVEFRAWLVEERMLNPETMPKDQTRKEFARFVEDFNTATLPDAKFYNMEAYDRRMNALRAGEFVPPPEDAYDPEADLRAHKNKHKRAAGESESYLSREQLQELRRVQQERVEVGKMKLLGMEIKQNMGVRMDSTTFDD